MSTVTLIIIRGNRMFVIAQHYRIIKTLLEAGLSSIICLKNKATARLDEGYILYDDNRKMLFNGQRAFRVPSLDGVEITELWP